MEPTTESWTTPQGVELCIVRSGPATPDQLARLVEWLRQCYAHYGTWTSKPAPLYFEQALKEYLADYSYDLAEAGDGAQEEGLDGADDE